MSSFVSKLTEWNLRSS